MSMRVIGLGVGRTGTYSMKHALEQLNFGPCHHMEEVDARSPEQISVWTSAANGKVDWKKVYAGYNSAVDWPTAAFCRELATTYPDAKFILTIRDPEKWYASFSQTIVPLIQPTAKTPTELLPFLRMVMAVVQKTGFRIPSTKEDIDAPVKLRQAEFLMCQIINAPHWLDRELNQACQLQAKRNCKARSHVALAIAAGDTVHCQHHDLYAHLLRLLHH